MFDLKLPIRAATETAIAHGIVPVRCDILQNGSTLVLRLTESNRSTATVMIAWYPILYPDADVERQRKLQRRLDWLAAV